MIFTVGPSIAIRVQGAIARSLGIDIGVLYAVMVGIIALALTAAIMSRKSKPKDR